MKVNGKKTKWKDKENIHLKKVIMYMKENLKMEIKREKVNSYFLMENPMKVTIKIIKKKVMVFINSKIKMFIVEIG